MNVKTGRPTVLGTEPPQLPVAFMGVKVYPAETTATGLERVQHFTSMAGYIGYEAVDTQIKEGKRPTPGRLRSMRWRKA